MTYQIEKIIRLLIWVIICLVKPVMYKLIDLLLRDNQILSIANISSINSIDKSKLNYQAYLEIENLNIESFISKNKNTYDLIIFDIKDNEVQKNFPDNLKKIIKFCSNTIILKVDYSNSGEKNKNLLETNKLKTIILEIIKKDFAFQLFPAQENQLQQNFVLIAKSNISLSRPNPLNINHAITDFSAIKDDYFYVAEGFKANNLRKEVNECLPFVRSKNHAIDVGARHGCFTRALFDEGFKKVTSFELVSHFREAFLKNVDTRNVDFFNTGLYDKKTRIKFEGRAGKGIAGVNVNDGKLVYSLDCFDFTELDLLKIDVDGCERQILRGAKNLIKKFKPVVHIETEDIQLRHDPENLKRIEDIYQWLLDNEGYKIGVKNNTKVSRGRNTVLYYT